MSGTSHYKLALYLTIFLVGINIAFFALVDFRAGIFAVAALIIIFGLWVQSAIIRYVGAIWLIISLGSVLWPLVSGERIVWTVGLSWVILLGVLSAAIAYLLLFSKRFSAEFSYERERQPQYKKVLKKLFFAALAVAAIAATLVDIYNLTSENTQQ